ncbi:hypothetical protein SCMC78_18460 [Streptomyces sp. CMC78]|uniref:Uncharacterized protein n=1 Tax=Streptomyces sp. CMC78 TaxID=3231512 RepID=A0AB33K8P7_9ACTN
MQAAPLGLQSVPGGDIDLEVELAHDAISSVSRFPALPARAATDARRRGLFPSRRIHHWQVLPTYEVRPVLNIRNDPITYTYLARVPYVPRHPTGGPGHARRASGRPESGVSGRTACPPPPPRPTPYRSGRDGAYDAVSVIPGYG